MPFRTIVLVMTAWALTTPGTRLSGQEDLSVLTGWMRHSDAENSLYRHLAELAYGQLDERESRIASLRGQEQWLERKEAVRSTLRRLAGRFPERGPLNARITGTLSGEDFRVEKLIYESVPGYLVTAAVFVPEGPPSRRPAIVYASGHAAEGFRSVTYQTAILNLVKKGFVVLAFDPVGQGERRQYDDVETGESRIGGPTREHSYPGAQIFITGDSPALYFIWDGIRAIDYLVTRDDVDPQRIGVTGRSGGGTQSSYIAAFDERVRAVAPENYLSSFRRILESVGPQDAEQNLFHGIRSGIDHGDLILAHAPKPYLLIATTRDMFSIQGVRETAEEAGRAYRALGEPAGFRVAEDDAGHASTVKNREAMYGFFQAALDLPGDATEVPVSVIAVEDLFVTATGQVASSGGSEDLFSLNRTRAEALVEGLKESRERRGHLNEVRAAAAELSGYLPPAPTAGSTFVGRLHRDGYSIEQHVIQGEGDYAVPMLLGLPSGDGPHPAVVYLHPDGKAEDARMGGPVEALVRRGFAVLAPDLIGTGEVGPGDFRGDAYDYGVGVGAYNLWWGANQVGRSLVGIRAGDVVRAVRYLEGRDDVDRDRISGIGLGTLGPVLLHAASFDRAITRVALVEPPSTYAEIVSHRYYRPEFVHAVVPGALAAYDLPDLAATVAPRPLLIADAVDHWGRPMRTDAVLEEYQVAVREYGRGQGASALTVQRGDPGDTRIDLVLRWLEGSRP